MKKKINKILQMLEPRPLPDKATVLAACPTVPVVSQTAPIRRRLSPAKVAALAMSALLVIGGGVGVAAAEAKAYGEAINFFEQYNLSAEGFTRSEVKKIYKDIVSESFTYEKTEEALASGLEGYEIQAQPLDSEGLRRVWMVGYQFGIEVKDYSEQSNVEYRASHLEFENSNEETTGKMNEITRFENGEEVWRKRLDIYHHSICAARDQVVVAGSPTPPTPGGDNNTVKLYLLNSDSSICWEKSFGTTLSWVNVDYVMYNGEKLVLFCVGSNERLEIVEMDLNGNVLNIQRMKYNEKGYGIAQAVEVSGGYLIQKDGKLLQAKDGTVSDLATFSGNGDTEYRITDMIEFNGLVYISGRIVPKNEDIVGGAMGQYDLYMEQFGEEGATDEEMLEFYRKNHTAVLMICDPDSGEPKNFYTIPGASGGKLSVANNKLTWNVNRYTGAEPFTIATGDLYSVYRVTDGCLGNITADVWQYVFSPYGQIVGEKDTGSSVEFEG